MFNFPNQIVSCPSKRLLLLSLKIQPSLLKILCILTIKNIFADDKFFKEVEFFNLITMLQIVLTLENKQQKRLAQNRHATRRCWV